MCYPGHVIAIGPRTITSSIYASNLITQKPLDITMATNPPRSLRDLLHTLPQELYDEIFHMTFTADAAIRKLNIAFKKRVVYKSSTKGSICWREPYFYSNVAAVFPPLLHVSRSTRAQFAKSYYGQGAFVAAHDRDAVRKWAEILPSDHRSLLGHVSIVAKKPSASNAVRAQRMRVQFANDFGEPMNFEIGVVESIATKLGVPVKKLADTLGL
ncbi:hypothetical protein AC578_6828 [Pseudocercospora eumusae]|uniref:F-box domain-containing protein n=1 Tax=Pseudocercospora eumusae TaxID=321146 RepID=A0A139H779_9PEZI|nr:hypothetical protein AC578_6828 [Pseudocercospora eumusae]